MKKCLIFIFLASVASLSGALKNINEKSVRVSEALGKIYLLHQQNKFLVEDSYGLHEIDSCWLDTNLRKLAKNEEALDKFLEVGTIEIKRDMENNYLLRHHVQGLGGGPGLGFTVYWAVKAGLVATTVVPLGVVSVTSAGTAVPFTAGLGAFILGAGVEGIALAAGLACGMAPTP
jgi:hypothetical protein